ncbi:MAG TPA: PP2C family protein-serine/threonine phosphatase [Spirochaetota bacterium]|nr:PP2C family protein-serine/threonine phosphatase [Spirochaetota bacterium]HPS86287.1 PP2C family protein-serine/threonine phosphatase [Spirochaetota bacterium]
MNGFSPYIIPPLLCLLTGYSLAIVSLIWGKFKKENIFLALICFWWTLLSYVFIYHNIENNQEKVMAVERVVHTLYVFAPAVTITFFQIITNKVNKVFILLCSILSLILAFFVHTTYYFYGFYTYEWGMIAKSGAAFQVFSAYAALSTLYIFILFFKKVRVEKNNVIRLKFYYLFISYFLSAFLTFTNFPAMHGIDIYPLSNFIFIPLGIMTYGVLKYRLVTISGVLHKFIFWLALSSMIAVPNIFIFILIKNNFNRLDSVRLLILFLVWFFANYYYFNKIQPLINQLFNRRNYNLSQMEKIFIKDLAMLKNLDELVYQMITMLRKTLNVEQVSLYIRKGYSGSYMDSRGNCIDIDQKTEKSLLEGTFFERNLIESEEELISSAGILLPIFTATGSEYIVPLVHQRELLAILTLKEKINRIRVKDNEIRFICNLSSYATVALANSVMYQNLADMKDNLEKIVEDRTALIERQKSDMESDIQLARKIQMALLPQNLPDVKKLKVAFRYEPIMGVGGDFIDIHYREGMDEYGIFICDVSGHGSSSAMIASMVKMSLHSWGKFIQHPAEAFIEIRNLLRGKIGDNFITAYMCCIDLKSGIITSACAGHPPMILIRKNGTVEQVKPAGKILFDLIDSEYEESKKTLNDGDKIILYTDGVFEARDSSGKMLGEERFIQMLSENSSLSAEDLCQRIYNETFTPEGNIIDDDFALLVAEYKN